METREHGSRRSLLGRISFTLMMGAALAWVLLRRRTETLPANEDLTCSPAQVTPAEIDITTPLVAEHPEEASPAEERRDRLETIHGIGPKFAERLHAAGVHTFSALAAQSPEHLLEIVQAQPWQKVEPEQWIQEAKDLVGLG